MNHLEIITTGGTIEKTYDEQHGDLRNSGSIVHRMLTRLRLEDTTVHVRPLLNKDSLHITEDDRELIRKATVAATDLSEGVVILHGTDSLETTGEYLHASIPNPRVPIVLTGAMRPYEMKRSDALQNLTEAILAARLAPPAIYVACHGRVLKFPGVTKDREHMTFRYVDDSES